MTQNTRSGTDVDFDIDSSENRSSFRFVDVDGRTIVIVRSLSELIIAIEHLIDPVTLHTHLVPDKAEILFIDGVVPVIKVDLPLWISHVLHYDDLASELLTLAKKTKDSKLLKEKVLLASLKKEHILKKQVAAKQKNLKLSKV